jgi:hypothetical protein
MISVPLNRHYAYNVVVGKPVGRQKLYHTDSTIFALLIRLTAKLRGAQVKVYRANIDYTPA